MARERTLCLMKPDATRRNLTGKITAIIEEAGLSVVAQRRMQLTLAQARVHLAHTCAMGCHEKLCALLSSGPVVVQVLEGEDAIARFRKLMGGGTNPCVATPGTLRRTFALDAFENAVHGADSPASAAREISFFFSDADLLG